MPKPNYRLAKKQKEQSRAARQLEKQRRRSARTGALAPDGGPLPHPPADAGDPAARSEIAAASPPDLD